MRRPLSGAEKRRAQEQNADEQVRGYEGMRVSRETGVHVTEEDFLPPQKSPRLQDVKPPSAPVRDSDLPLVSAMDNEDMTAFVELIEDAVAYQEQLAALTEAMSRTKRELAAYASIYKMERGLRHGQIAIRIQRGQTRKTLDKGLLMLNGCPPEAIEKSYKEGEPYDVVTVVDGSKPRNTGGAGGSTEGS